MVGDIDGIAVIDSNYGISRVHDALEDDLKFGEFTDSGDSFPIERKIPIL